MKMEYFDAISREDEKPASPYLTTFESATGGKGKMRTGLPAPGTAASEAVAVPAGGSHSTVTLGSSGELKSGYAEALVNSGAGPYGTAVFRFKQNGVVVSETGVPSSPPTTRAQIFIDYRASVAAIPGRTSAGRVDINTGIALVNCGSASATITYQLRDFSGAILSKGQGTLPAGGHIAKFIDQLNEVAPGFNLPANFKSETQFGSLEISSDQPLSILALRMTINQRKETLFTSTPIADLTKPNLGDALFFPQFADGGGYTTSLVLLNVSNDVETEIVQILDDFGNPLVVQDVGGTFGSTFRYSIPIGGGSRFQTDGVPSATNVGWARLTPDDGTSTPAAAGMFGYNPGEFMLTESGIPTAVTTTHARIYVDMSGGHGTGLAIANPESTAANISVMAYKSDGATGIGSSPVPLEIPANGHTAFFVDERISGLTAEFTGVLEIRSPTAFAALTMRSLYNEREDFLLTAFPIADMTRSAPAPIVFPHIADGGGYGTQFILIGTQAASNVILNFYDEEGRPLPVGR